MYLQHICHGNFVNSSPLIVSFAAVFWDVTQTLPMYLFFPPKSPTEILKLMPQRRYASETLEFSAGFAAFFGVREEFFRAAFIRLNLANLQNVYNTVAWISDHISLIWQIFSQGRRLLFDLINGGAKLTAAPLERETVGSCYSLPIFFAPSPLLYEPHRHYPRAFCTLPSFARMERPRWRPVKLNHRHLRSHRKIGDCEQSISCHQGKKWYSVGNLTNPSLSHCTYL